MDFEDNNPLSASMSEGELFSGISELQQSQLYPKLNNGMGRRSDSGPVPDAATSSASTDSIAIVDAGKSREGPQRGHIVYTIKLPSDVCVRRRYSEFETLRRVLRRVFPTVVIPPIPEKHSFSAYAASPAHAQEDAKTIEHRRRMLAAFLNRCMATPGLRDSWLFERFLDPNTTWNEVLNSDLVLHLPKSSLQAPPLDPTHPTPAHAYLPIPPSGARLAVPSATTKAVKAGSATPANSSGSGSGTTTNTGGDGDKDGFREAEQNAKEYELTIGSGLERAVRRATKHYTQLAADFADLGGQFNAFSLDSHVSFTNGIEKVGQAVDTGYLSTEMLIRQLSVEFTEPLAESVQMAATARQVLKYRRMRALQVEMTADSLATKRQVLADLEKAETEAQRISSYLGVDERISAAMANTNLAPAASATSEPPEQQRPSYDGGDEDVRSLISIDTLDEPAPPPAPAQKPSRPTPAPSLSRRFRLPGLSQINHAISGMMDADPEASRRSNITRTQEQIAHLVGALEVAKEDSEAASSAVKDELARYKTTKEADVKRLVRAFVRCHVEWAEKNLESWLEARQALAE